MSARSDIDGDALERSLDTSFGPVGFLDTEEGHPAIFLHGLCLNSYFWRHQLPALSGLRRCIAIDILAHGRTPAIDLDDYGFEAQASMVLEVADRLRLETFDLVGNDSGGAIAQVVSARAPDRISSLTLTNCDVHDNWPPKQMGLILFLARRGWLGRALQIFYKWPWFYRTPVGYAARTYEDKSFATDKLMRRYCAPLITGKARRRSIARYCALEDDQILVRYEQDLKKFHKPALIVWGDADQFFPVEWADWLENTLGGPCEKHILHGGKIFFPEERAPEFTAILESFWRSQDSGQKSTNPCLA